MTAGLAQAPDLWGLNLDRLALMPHLLGPSLIEPSGPLSCVPVCTPLAPRDSA